MIKKLPARVYEKHGAYYYFARPQEKPLWDGKTWFRLGADYTQAMALYRERMAKIQMKPTTFGFLVEQWTKEHVNNPAKVRPATSRSYRAALKNLRPVFDHVDVENVSRKHIRMYYDLRKSSSHTNAQREIEVIRLFLNWCVDMEYIEFNPANKLKFARPAPRERYVDDAEVIQFLQTAGPLLNLYVPLKIYTGARKNDLLSLTHKDWTEQGLFIGDRKSFRVNTGRKSRGRIFAYTPELAEIMNNILRQSGNTFLFSTKDDLPYINFEQDTTYSFDSVWQRAKQRAVKAGMESPFQERDLRAKAATDSHTLEEARAMLGHSTTLVTKTVYRRKPEIVKKTA